MSVVVGVGIRVGISVVVSVGVGVGISVVVGVEDGIYSTEARCLCFSKALQHVLSA